jgi:hypothetical protein
MSVEVNTRTYEFSHGKLPRGRGYWAFEINGETLWSNPHQPYGEAVSDARKVAVIRGAREVKVLP